MSRYLGKCRFKQLCRGAVVQSRQNFRAAEPLQFKKISRLACGAALSSSPLDVRVALHEYTWQLEETMAPFWSLKRSTPRAIFIKLFCKKRTRWCKVALFKKRKFLGPPLMVSKPGIINNKAYVSRIGDSSGSFRSLMVPKRNLEALSMPELGFQFSV